MRTLVRAAAVSVASFALLVSGFGAQALAQEAPTPSLPAEIQDEYREVFAHHGVAVDRWDALLAKLSTGQLLDADNSSAIPISTEGSSLDGMPATRNLYADGSVSFSSAPVSETVLPAVNIGGIQPFGTSVQLCNVSTSNGFTHRKNCRIVYDGITFSYLFRADFRTKPGTTAHIAVAFNPVLHRAIGHGVSSIGVGIPRSYQTGGIAAQARMSFEATALYVAWSRTITLDLFVRDQSWWSDTNL